MSRITATWYDEGDREEETDAISVQVPHALGERMSEEMMDNYFYLSEKEATELRDALNEVLNR